MIITGVNNWVIKKEFTEIVKAIFFLFFDLQICRLHFKQIEIKIKFYILGFSIADSLKKGEKIGTFHIGLFGIKMTRVYFSVALNS